MVGLVLTPAVRLNALGAGEGRTVGGGGAGGSEGAVPVAYSARRDVLNLPRRSGVFDSLV